MICCSQYHALSPLGNTGCVEIKRQFQSQSMAYQWQQKLTVPFSQQFCTLSLEMQLKQLFYEQIQDPKYNSAAGEKEAKYNKSKYNKGEQLQ